jgi:SPP1 family predicted phage head-tail adaptor
MVSKGMNAGRMRHQLDIYAPGVGSDAYGKPNAGTFLFSLRANVDVKSGKEAAALNKALTSEVITCLCWYDTRVENKMELQWRGKTYRIDHIKPGEMNRQMIITAERDGE